MHSVDVEHPSFEEWWEPFTLGVGPAGAHVASLDADQQAQLRERCRELLPGRAVRRHCQSVGRTRPRLAVTLPAKEARMNQVSEILGDKGKDVLKIEANAPVLEAVKQMVDANVGSLLVTEGGEVTGIVTERDYLRRVAHEGPADDNVTVRDIMSSPLVVVGPDTKIDECMAVMTDRRIRHLPVVEDGDVVGIVSIGDVVKFKSKQQSFEIRYLTDYITSG